MLRARRLIRVLRGPFHVSGAEQSAGIAVTLVVLFGPEVLWMAGRVVTDRGAWPLAILMLMVVGVLVLLRPRSGAPLTLGTLASGVWLAGSIRLVQGLFVLVTGRVPRRVTPSEVVPRVAAITPLMSAMAFWAVGFGLTLWNERRRYVGRRE